MPNSPLSSRGIPLNHKTPQNLCEFLLQESTVCNMISLFFARLRGCGWLWRLWRCHSLVQEEKVAFASREQVMRARKGERPDGRAELTPMHHGERRQRAHDDGFLSTASDGVLPVRGDLERSQLLARLLPRKQAPVNRE